MPHTCHPIVEMTALRISSALSPRPVGAGRSTFPEAVTDTGDDAKSRSTRSRAFLRSAAGNSTCEVRPSSRSPLDLRTAAQAFGSPPRP